MIKPIIGSVILSAVMVAQPMTARAQDTDQETRTIRCSFKGSPKVRNCKAIAYRYAPGEATIDITFPDGYTRTIVYKNGEFSAANDADEVTSADNGTSFRVSVNRGNETFVIPTSFAAGE